MAIGDYAQTEWNTGDVITEAKLDNNEDKTDELDEYLYNLRLMMLYKYRNFGEG